MEVLLNNLGRRFNQHWVFKNLSYPFIFPETYAILGANGSGKSTLLQIVSGFLSPSEGSVSYQANGLGLPVEGLYKKLSYCAPYIELPDQLTVLEFFTFHFSLKGLHPSFSLEELLEESTLVTYKNQLIWQLSSGIRQRVKLLATLAANVPLILLDEPTLNLDAGGIRWFSNLFQVASSGRSILMGSNLPEEYALCRNQLNIQPFTYPKDR